MLLSLSLHHPALARVSRVVLTNCESYEKFPPPGPLSAITGLSRVVPTLVQEGLRLQTRFSAGRRQLMATVSATEIADDLAASFFGPMLRHRAVAGDLVAAMATFRPQLLLDAAQAIRRFDRPVLLIWGDSCDFFPMADARRLASDFPDATVVPVAGAKTWVPLDNPDAVADAIAEFVGATTQ
jgi:pimeloyl-ACP methyl ester carboxylesterase